ncbi:hypothetical protein B0T14DRAFT_577566, partial [Immersiella caudata]
MILQSGSLLIDIDQNFTKNITSSPHGTTTAATMKNSTASASFPPGLGPPTTPRASGANTDRPLVLLAGHPFSAGAGAAANPTATAWPTVAEFTAAGDILASQGLARRLPPPALTLVAAPKSAPPPALAPAPVVVSAPAAAPTAPANPTAAPFKPKKRVRTRKRDRRGNAPSARPLDIKEGATTATSAPVVSYRPGATPFEFFPGALKFEPEQACRGTDHPAGRASGCGPSVGGGGIPPGGAGMRCIVVR